MFNLAQNRKLKELVKEVAKGNGPSLHHEDRNTKVPKKYLQEQTVFQGTIKSMGRNESIVQDAKSIALHLLNKGISDPSEIMNKVDKWKYIREFHPKYYQAVVRQIKRYLINGGAELRKTIPPIPQKAQPPAGGGGGDMGGGAGLAFNVSRMKKEAQMYLYRRDSSPHKLLGTIGSDIIAGKLQYLDEEGNPHAIRTISKESLSLRRSSPSIQEAKRINELMPDKIMEVIASFLKERKAEHADKIAKASYLRIRARKNYDLVPVSLYLSSPLHVLKMKIVNLSEPEELVELRSRIGRVCHPMISRLKNALLLDGVKFQEVRSFLPSYCINSHEKEPEEGYLDKHLNHEMHLLKEDTSTSTDIKSLLLTLTHHESKYKDQAAYRICDLISRYPQLVLNNEFSSSDLNAIKNSAPEYADKVIRILSMLKSDEADLTKTYFDGDDFDKYIVANLVVSLKKDNVFLAMPEMCMLNNSVNLDLFEKLNPKDPTTTKILLKIKMFDLDVPQMMFEKKIAEVLCERRDEDLIRMGLAESMSLASFCLALLVEDGILEEKDFTGRYHGSGRNENVALAAISIMEKKPDLLPKFQEEFKVMPATIAIVSCKDHAAEYMKINRLTWDGKIVPTASEMFSIPENPMNLAVSLINIQDSPAMIALLYNCCKKFSDGYKDVKPTILLLVRELKRQKQEEKAYMVLSTFGIELGSEEDILPDEAATPDRIMFYIQSGNIVAAAHLLNQLFGKDEEAARMTLENLPKPKDAETFLELLPVELITNVQLPNWAKALYSKATVLPNGFVVTGSNGIYQCMNISFSCDSKSLIESAMKVVVGR